MKSPTVMLTTLVLAIAMTGAPFVVNAQLPGDPGIDGGHGSGHGSGQGSGSGMNQGSGQGSGQGTAQGSGQGSGQGGGYHQGMSDEERNEFRAQRIIDSLDIDGSGDLSLDEFLSKPQGTHSNPFERLDADQDGLISEDEYLGAQGAGYRGAGYNGMNVDRDALLTCMAQQGGSDWMSPLDRPTHFAEMDLNADGFVDPDEFEMARQGRAIERFDLIDANDDGIITLAELAAALGELGQHHTIRAECINEQRDLDNLQGG